MCLRYQPEREPAARGLLDDADYALAVNYFGDNATSPRHSAVFAQANMTLALALQLRRLRLRD